MNINNAHTFAGQRYSTEKFVENLLNLPQQFDQLIGKDQKIQQELIPIYWDSTTEFSKYEVVIYGNKFYYSKVNNNKNKNPQTQSTYWGDFAQLLKSNLFFEFDNSNVNSGGVLTLNTTNAIIGIVDNEGMFWNLANETVYYYENQIEIDLSGILELKNITSVDGTWKALMSGVNQEGFVFAEEDPIYSADKQNIVFKSNLMDDGARLIGNTYNTKWVYGEDNRAVSIYDSELFEDGVLYTRTLQLDTHIDFYYGAEMQMYDQNFGLLVTQTETPGTLELTCNWDSVWWSDNNNPPHYSAENPPPDISTPNRAYMIRLHWDAVGHHLLANLAYTEDII